MSTSSLPRTSTCSNSRKHVRLRHSSRSEFPRSIDHRRCGPFHWNGSRGILVSVHSPSREESGSEKGIFKLSCGGCIACFDAYFQVFPMQLAENCILASTSNPSSIVLDMYAGKFSSSNSPRLRTNCVCLPGCFHPGSLRMCAVVVLRVSCPLCRRWHHPVGCEEVQSKVHRIRSQHRLSRRLHAKVRVHVSCRSACVSTSNGGGAERDQAPCQTPHNALKRHPFPSLLPDARARVSRRRPLLHGEVASLAALAAAVRPCFVRLKSTGRMERSNSRWSAAYPSVRVHAKPSLHASLASAQHSSAQQQRVASFRWTTIHT